MYQLTDSYQNFVLKLLKFYFKFIYYLYYYVPALASGWTWFQVVPSNNYDSVILWYVMLLYYIKLYTLYVTYAIYIIIFSI